uniref:Uncharacterized protein n=1 Tax=Steinernema glaseri TaxID=37863 RepID=A0A1I7YSA8_9BILA
MVNILKPCDPQSSSVRPTDPPHKDRQPEAGRVSERGKEGGRTAFDEFGHSARSQTNQRRSIKSRVLRALLRLSPPPRPQFDRFRRGGDATPLSWSDFHFGIYSRPSATLVTEGARIGAGRSPRESPRGCLTTPPEFTLDESCAGEMGKSKQF